MKNKLIEMQRKIEICEGFPVAAIALDNAKKVLAVETNAKGYGCSTDYKTHAEYIISEKLSTMAGNVETMIITLPACKDCLVKLEQKFKNLKKIIYLFDPWGKVHKEYVKHSRIQFEVLILQENPSVHKMWKTVIDKLEEPSHRGPKERLKRIHENIQIGRILTEEQFLSAKSKKLFRQRK